MNNDLLRWLLDIDAIPPDSSAETGLRLSWEHPIQPWMWAVIFIAAGLFAIWSYSRLAGWRPARGMMATARFAIIFLAIILLSGPMLELPRETIEEDWVILLADRSASMTIKDVYTSPNDPTSPRVSRDQQLRDALGEHTSIFEQLTNDREVFWLGFHVGAYNLSPSGGGAVATSELDAVQEGFTLPELGEATGRRTRLTSSIQQALQRAAARPISGVVLLSDGRADAPLDRALLRRLQADAIPVFSVPFGSSEPIGDLAVRRVHAPTRAFVRDKVPVIVEVEKSGSVSPDHGASGGVIKLVDELTGEVLDEKEIGLGNSNSTSESITLTAEPSLAGETTWKVVVETSRPDLIPENNVKGVEIELIDRPLRVLYIEGYPRWEYRYVKNLLVREQSIESSVILISADRDFAQEGNLPITRLPRSPEEFANYDVIILGDCLGTFFSPEQLNMIRDHVAERGAGLLWIAGERHTPASYAGTALADLVPIRGSLKVPDVGVPVNMIPTPQAERLGVLQLFLGDEIGWPRELTDPSFGWSQLYFAQRIEPGQLKPTAEVLAETVRSFNGTPLPLVIGMRYGAGQSIYVASDEIWRWRYGRGELLPEQFWVQMIRLLGRESLASGGDRAVFEVTPRRVAINQPIRIHLRLLDAQYVEGRRETVHVVLETESGERVTEIELRRIDGTEDQFASVYLPNTTGQLRVRVDDSSLRQLDLQAPLEVFSPDDELRQPEADHNLLASLSAATGGRVLQPNQLDQLPGLLPNREVRTMNPLTETIWDSPLAFALVLFLLTFEWVGRKFLRLV